MYERRDFLKTIAAGSIGCALLPDFLFSSALKTGAVNTPVYNRLTCFTLLDDIIRVAVKAKILPFQFYGDLYSDINMIIKGNFSRMGWLVSTDAQQAMAIYNQQKQLSVQLWNNMTNAEKDNPESEAMILKYRADCKAALMLGWIMSAGIREIFEPLWISAGDSVDEMCTYQDMYVLKQVAGRSFPASEENVKSLFENMLPRMITRTHTLRPDYDDAFEWTVRISQWHKQVAETMAYYASVYADPDEEKQSQYITDILFYDPADDVIAAARGESGPDWDTMPAAQSLYGQAIVLGVESLLNTAHTSTVISAEDNFNLPDKITLHGNYPNPFNGQTHISFELAGPAELMLVVVNSLGQIVYRASEEYQTAGNYRIQIEADSWASGVYHYRITARFSGKTVVKSGQMVYVK